MSYKLQKILLLFTESAQFSCNIKCQSLLQGIYNLVFIEGKVSFWTNNSVCLSVSLSVCPPKQLLTQLVDIYEIQYEGHVVECNIDFVRMNF
jgi:hypothetical protein